METLKSEKFCSISYEEMNKINGGRKLEHRNHQLVPTEQGFTAYEYEIWVRSWFQWTFAGYGVGGCVDNCDALP